MHSLEELQYCLTLLLRVHLPSVLNIYIDKLAWQTRDHLFHFLFTYNWSRYHMHNKYVLHIILCIYVTMVTIKNNSLTYGDPVSVKCFWWKSYDKCIIILLGILFNQQVGKDLFLLLNYCFDKKPYIIKDCTFCY